MRRRQVLIGTAALAGAATLGRRAFAADKGTVRLAYVEWSDAIVATNILAATLEQAGYKVTMTPVSAAAMWEAVATGDADAMVAAWLPVTHAAYYSKLKDQVDLIGPNLTGARLGWATPDYVPLTSIPELKTQGALVGNQVIGIDPGAGLMRASEKAIKEYDLTNITLVDGSDATMVAALEGRDQPEEAHRRHELDATLDVGRLQAEIPCRPQGGAGRGGDGEHGGAQGAAEGHAGGLCDPRQVQADAARGADGDAGEPAARHRPGEDGVGVGGAASG